MDGQATQARPDAFDPKAAIAQHFILQQRDRYGPLTGFLYGWTRFWIASPGSIAAYAVAAVTFLESILPIANHRPKIAISIIVFFTILNCFSVQFGGAVQTVMTAIKIFMIIGLAGSILTFGAGTSRLLNLASR